MNVIVFHAPSSERVSVITPSYGDQARPSGDTDDQLIAREVEKHVPNDGSGQKVPYYVVDHTVVPQDRTFRDAWECPSGNIVVNMVKARTIHMDTIRVARATELTKADHDVNRAQDQGDATAEAAARAKRQELRDIPQTFDLSVCTIPETQKAAWPAELPPKS